jgi:RHS repeat-associated protein
MPVAWLISLLGLLALLLGGCAHSPRPVSVSPVASRHGTVVASAVASIAHVPPPAPATGYAYNTRGLLSTVTEPSTQATSFTYDDAQRLTSTTDPVGTITYGRDTAGRVTTVVEGSKTLTRVYGAYDRLVSFTDGDGNTIGYTYDALGRLTKLTYPGTPLKEVTYAYDAAGQPNRHHWFQYDHLGRRVRYLDFNWSGGTWVPVNDHRFIYRGHQLIAEYWGAYNGGSLVTTNVRHSYWGLDLTGTLGGAGGIGGLLLAHEGGNSYLPAYDALGNVHAMIKASDGTLAAIYEYDAFGRTIRETGPYAASNPFRFSTKYTDTETGGVDFGRRIYLPSLARFANRDPISEDGGLNLYAYALNDPTNAIDINGELPILLIAVPFVIGFGLDVGFQMGGNWLASRPVGNISYGRATVGGVINVAGFGLVANIGRVVGGARTVTYAANTANTGVWSNVGGNVVRTPLTSVVRDTISSAGVGNIAGGVAAQTAATIVKNVIESAELGNPAPTTQAPTVAPPSGGGAEGAAPGNSAPNTLSGSVGMPAGTGSGAPRFYVPNSSTGTMFYMPNSSGSSQSSTGLTTPYQMEAAPMDKFVTTVRKSDGKVLTKGPTISPGVTSRPTPGAIVITDPDAIADVLASLGGGSDAFIQEQLRRLQEGQLQ